MRKAASMRKVARNTLPLKELPDTKHMKASAGLRPTGCTLSPLGRGSPPTRPAPFEGTTSVAVTKGQHCLLGWQSCPCSFFNLLGYGTLNSYLPDVFLLPTQEGKTAAGVESRPRPPGANRPERSSRLKCTTAGVRGRLPPRLVPPATASGRCEHLDGLTSCREISLAAFTSHKSAAQVG